MARGTIFYITRNPEQDISFGESNYYDKLDVLKLDYVKDQDGDESEVPLECLKKMLAGLGAAVTGWESPFSFMFRFRAVEKAKRDYFAPRLEKFKKQAQALTIESVMRSAPALDFILDNEYGDIITLAQPYGETDLTLDDFLRQLEPDVSYYVYGRVILMH